MDRLFAIFIDCVIACSFYFGLTLSNEGLINVGYFAGWLFASINIIGGFLGKEEIAKHYTHQHISWRAYDAISNSLYVIFAAYSGWFVLASFFAIGSMVKAEISGKIEKDLLKARQESNTGN
ncbi:hypothetical protein ABN306_06880 [Providencia huaxiensis]|uniref:hypothetical protein n=1 Tax=Morganellaceae TaxID=1903414 RepID=UPI001B37CCEF|nr:MULTISPECIES: hypothetical protein [Morganellaceae]EHZ7762353.1 hypothetical protein [Providencia rettgeri]EIJ7165495.1 hypothetical protein [Providencia rettgeri]MBQ0607226.1 hypothetical protein [Providencia rettgeri]MCJ2222170.1 hypothetical protein [Providencia rettgeri]MDF7401164.1 hypothetical protein [Proteus mirabilis]